MTLTEAQTWATIGVLAAAVLGTITLVTTLLGRTITAQFVGLRNEMNARFDTVDARFDTVDARFDAVNGRIDNLDRDVQTITHKVFGKEY